MPRLIRHTLLSARDLLASAGPFIVLGLALLAGAYLWLEPAPPRRVVLATGPENSAYAEFGKRYAEELARYGVRVELRATQGTAENLRLLRDRAQNVDLAFVQGGAGDALYAADEAHDGAALMSLGALFYEPVWLFYRADAARRDALTELGHLAGLRVNLGAEGDGAANLFAKLAHANRIAPESLVLSRLPPTPAVVAFLGGELDALVFVSAPESPLVQMLLMTPGVRLFDFAQAEAYARRFAFLSALQLPRGVVDLAADIPPADVRLIAATTRLVARADTHPALVQLFVQTAARIHGGTGWFARAGQFPIGADPELPLASEAARFYRNGAPLLQRYLPFWLANLIDRMWVALLSIVAVLIPASRIVPPLYRHRIRSRVFRWYAQLREIEEALAARTRAPAQLLVELDALDERVGRISVPLSHADELYALRSHIDLVRARLRQAGAG
ncbi:MAG TPA: TAXI family TRAP transporter solute-binding subunit [Burkholderiaceae bacterium]|nr:TAXI family TRAP transporter solute-binding subunit [Burkholderiaceae bacterium]